MEVIEDAQVGTGLLNAKLDILFQIGLIAEEAAAGTLEPGNHVDGITDAAIGEKVFLIGERRTNRTQGTPGAQDQKTDEGLFMTQLVSFATLQEGFFSRGEGTGIESMFPGIRITGLTTTPFLWGTCTEQAFLQPQRGRLLRIIARFLPRLRHGGTYFGLFHGIQDSVDLPFPLVGIAKINHAGMNDILEASNGNGDGTQCGNMVMERHVRLRLFEDGIGGLGDDEAQDLGLILERTGDIGIEGGNLFGGVAAGVDAVLEGIGVAGLGAAAFWVIVGNFMLLSVRNGNSLA